MSIPTPFSDHAKLLWKRIPGAVKSSNPEVTALWEIGKQLWKHEYEGVYPLILQHDWPPHIAPLLQQLKGNHKIFKNTN